MFAGFARFSSLASFSSFGSFDVHLGLLDAREDLLEKGLVLRSVLPEPLVHGLHLLADGLDGFRGGRRLGG